jgi:hypothetical protein
MTRIVLLKVTLVRDLQARKAVCEIKEKKETQEEKRHDINTV